MINSRVDKFQLINFQDVVDMICNNENKEVFDYFKKP